MADSTDSMLLIVIMIFFILLGAILPFIDSAFNQDVTTHDASDISPPRDEEDFSSVNAIEVLLSIITVFFWSFSVPFYVNLFIIEPFRILGYYLVVRFVRGI